MGLVEGDREMPNVRQMEDRMASHLARVGGKAIEREFDRIAGLHLAGKVSFFTATALRQTAALRLAYIANAR